MTVETDIVERLRSIDFASELHKLLWIDPLTNRGQFDPGWNCRDHAWLTAALLTAHRVPCVMTIGKAMFVQGASSGHPPNGLGIDEGNPGIHCWITLADETVCDLSPNLALMKGISRSRPFSGIVSNVAIGSGDIAIVMTRKPLDYSNEIARATHRDGQLSAVYLALKSVQFDEAMVRESHRFINSPLTDRICPRFGHDVYAKAALHFLGRISGGRRSLAGVAQNKGWAIVAKEFGADAIANLGDRCGFSPQPSMKMA